MKTFLKKILHTTGYDIKRMPTDPIEKQQLYLLEKNRINLIFDIGANIGQYGLRMRKMGYRGQIVSFEPLPDAFAQLKAKADLDPSWTALNCAMGDFVGQTQINVAQNSYSSSILAMLPMHLEGAPESSYINKVDVMVNTVDSVIDQFITSDSRLYVKIDTQGFEKQVFEGCRKSMQKISGFQLELSLVSLYEGETLMQNMVDLLGEHGFKLMLIENGFCHQSTGELLQIEGYFYRPTLM